jgi:hypothetical protein
MRKTRWSSAEVTAMREQSNEYASGGARRNTPAELIVAGGVEVEDAQAAR